MHIDDTDMRRELEAPSESPKQCSIPSKTTGQTLADVLEIIRHTSSLSIQAKRDSISAIRKIASWNGPDGLTRPADPRSISEQIAKTSPAMAGLKKASMANLRYRIRRALKIAGISNLSGKSTGPLSPEWVVTAKALGDGPRWWSISRFAHFASEQNWKQKDIGSAHMEAFRDALTNGSIHRAPKNAFYQTIKTWNYCSANIENWPGRPIARESRARAYVIAEEALPMILKQEIDRHFDRLVNPSPFFSIVTNSKTSPFRRRKRAMSPNTLRAEGYRLRQYISALVATGMHPEEMTCLAVILTPELVLRGLMFFYERAGERMAPQIEQIGWVLVKIAQHSLKDEKLAKCIREMLANARQDSTSKPRQMSERVRRLLRQFDDPHNRTALLKLPNRITKLARSIEAKSPLKAARLFEEALAIQLLICCPLRIGNVAKLHIDKHFLRSRPSPNGLIHLVVSAEEAVKTPMPIEFELPIDLQRMFETYVTTYRPRLPGAESRWLFPIKHGAHENAKNLSSRISRVIRHHTGIKMTAHMFRHWAAEMLLDTMPGAFEQAGRLLGHAPGSDTADRFYTRRDMNKAVKLYNERVLKAKHEPAALRPGQHRRSRDIAP